MFRLSKWLRKSYRRAIDANIRRTRWSDLSIAVGSAGLWRARHRFSHDCRFRPDPKHSFWKPRG